MRPSQARTLPLRSKGARAPQRAAVSIIASRRSPPASGAPQTATVCSFPHSPLAHRSAGVRARPSLALSRLRILLLRVEPLGERALPEAREHARGLLGQVLLARDQLDVARRDEVALAPVARADPEHLVV